MNQPASTPEPSSPSAGLRKGARAIRVILALAAAVFIVLAARSLMARWESQRVELYVLPLILSLPPLVAGAWVLAWGWKKLLERMTGRRLPAGATVALQVESQLSRYVPGKVGVLLTRMAGASDLKTSPRIIGVSVLVETLSFLAVGGTAGVLTLVCTSEVLGESLDLLGAWGVPLLICLALGVVILLGLDRRFIPSSLRRFVDDGGRGAVVPLRLPFIHLAYWASWLVHGYFTSRAVGADHGAALASAGLYVLAPIAGFLALATPAGIGVREAVLAMGLSSALGPAQALSAAIASRGVSLVADVLAWLIVRPFARR